VLRDQLEDGAEAESLLEQMTPYLQRREKVKVDALISWFLVHPWDEGVAIKYITGLAEIRTQLDDLRYRAGKAQAARKELFSTAGISPTV
jgi:hypothetical protein